MPPPLASTNWRCGWLVSFIAMLVSFIAKWRLEISP